MGPIKKAQGQASVEYLLSLTGVFVALAGLTALCRGWVDRLWDTLCPFVTRVFFQ